MPQAKVIAVNGDAHKANLSNGHMTDNCQILEKHLDALRVLTSDKSFKEIEASLTKVLDLKDQVESLKKENDSLEIKHREARRTLDETHADTLGVVKNQKNDLEKQCEEAKQKLLKETEVRKKEESAKVKANARVDQVTKDLRIQENKYQELESKKKEFENTAKVANEKINRLQREAKQKDTEKLTLMETLDSAEAENDSLTTKLESMTKELEVWESYTNHLYSDRAETFSDRIEDIWKSSCEAISLFFKDGLKRGVVQNDKAWMDFKKKANLPKNIPIPQSESLTAKQMCTAVVLSVLARSLSQHIFIPTYVLKENISLRDFDFQEDINNYKRERLLRGLLTSVFKKAQTQDEQDRIQNVVNDVSRVVQTIADDSTINNFRSDLSQIVGTAQRFWYRVQQNREFFDSIVELDVCPDWQWQQPIISDRANPSSQNTSEENLEMGENLLVIFPGVYCMHEDECESVFPGIALSKSQTIAAATEVEKIRTSQRSELARPPHPKWRRSVTTAASKSVTTAAKDNFLGGERL